MSAGNQTWLTVRRLAGTWHATGESSTGEMHDDVVLWLTPLGELAGESAAPAGHSDHYTVIDGEVDGNILQFTQVYEDGQRTMWRAVVKDDGHGGIRMEHGTWSGQIKGSFNAVRSPDRTGEKLQAARLQGTNQRAVEGERAVVAKLQLTISSLERQLRLQSQDAEELHEVQARHEQLEQQLALEDELEELRVRYALLQSSGTDVDFTTRVDHLNDRLIARLQTWSKINGKVIEGSDKDDQILELGRNITPEQRQLLQLGVAQDNILELRSWLARFRIPDSGDRVPAPRPRLTTDEAFDESWAVMLKALSRALKPTYGSPFRDSPSPREMSEADPAVLSHKLDKKRRQLRRAVAHTKALASADYYLLVEDYLRAARSNRPKQSQKALWHRVTDYLKDAGLPADTIADIEDSVAAIQRSPRGRNPRPSSPPSPSSREAQDLRFDCRELERELVRVQTELDRERQRRDIAEAETAGLRDTLRDHIPSREARAQTDALREQTSAVELDFAALATSPGSGRSLSASPSSSRDRSSPGSYRYNDSPRSSPNSGRGHSRSPSPYARQQADARGREGYLSWRTSPPRSRQVSPSRRSSRSTPDSTSGSLHLSPRDEYSTRRARAKQATSPIRRGHDLVGHDASVSMPHKGAIEHERPFK